MPNILSMLYLTDQFDEEEKAWTMRVKINEPSISVTKNGGTHLYRNGKLKAEISSLGEDRYLNRLFSSSRYKSTICKWLRNAM